MRPSVEHLIEFLDLDQASTDASGRFHLRRFRADRPLFGGEALAAGLRAAAHGSDVAFTPHSLHCNFLRAGRGDRLVVATTTLRSGRTVVSRQVVLTMDDVVVATMSVSMHRSVARDDYHVPMGGDLPDPDGDGPWYDDPFTHLDDTLPFEVRHVSPVVASPVDRKAAPSTGRLWVRLDGEALGSDDPVIHLCALALASDMRTGSAAGALAGPWNGAVSLDHAMWFHRPVAADDWFAIDIQPRSVAGGRGLVLGTIHDATGTLGATFAQEALLGFSSSR